MLTRLTLTRLIGRCHHGAGPAHQGDACEQIHPIDRGDRRRDAPLVRPDKPGRHRDHGVQPLAHALDAEGANAIAVTLEADGSGAIYPVLYTRIAGSTTDFAIEPDLLMRYDTPETRRAVEAVAARLS